MDKENKKREEWYKWMDKPEIQQLQSKINTLKKFSDPNGRGYHDGSVEKAEVELLEYVRKLIKNNQ